MWSVKLKDRGGFKPNALYVVQYRLVILKSSEFTTRSTSVNLKSANFGKARNKTSVKQNSSWVVAMYYNDAYISVKLNIEHS